MFDTYYTSDYLVYLGIGICFLVGAIHFARFETALRQALARD